ncbi:MAG: type IV pilus twitching motility protein PilT [Bradymonadaceae bacterium]|nr:type IV pilus twitching motility protein PilT [Lujinxingiaceae bacterium]
MSETDLNKILQVAVKGGASDIHLKAGLPPIFRVDGSLLPLRDAKRLSPEDLGKMAVDIMSKYQRDEFQKQLDVDLSYGVPGVGRFRVNCFQQRGSIGLVFRVIPFKVNSVEELLLPEVVKKLCDERRGLILVTGATGSGKSTTMASMIDYVNQTRTAHIVTIEDPIEFLIRDKRSIINQREIGNDTGSFARALKAALRQDPDVIMLGEMRDIETIEIAMTAAETGHLVISTLHTVDAAEAVTRVVTAFPPHMRDQARYQFSNLFRGVIAQRLVPRADGKGRVPAVEVMLSTARIRELIMEQATARIITEQMAKGFDNYGMQSFDQSLMWLLQNGYITYEEALIQSSNPDDFALRVSGIGSTSNESEWKNFESSAGGANKNKSGGNDFDLDDFEIDRF